MARERKPKQIAVQLELEDNCGAVISRTMKNIAVKMKDGSQIATAGGRLQVIEAFEKFVESLPAEFEV
jgi:hypothetical protein